MKEILLTRKQVGVIENCSKSTISRRIRAGVYEITDTQKTKVGGGKNGQEPLIALSYCSDAAQQQYWRQVYEIDKQPAAELAKQFQIQIPSEKLSDPKTATKIRMLSECLAVPEGARGRHKRIGVIAESYGFHVGTAYRLIKKVQKGKPLFKKYNNPGVRFDDLGITLRAWDQEAGKLVIEAIMANRRNKVEKLALYNKVCGQAESQNLRVGTYESFCWIARKINANRGAVLTYRDKGIQGLKQDVMPAIRRDPTAYRPMECLIGDQHKADYYAFDSNGNVATLELFCWMDFRTQLVWSAFSLKHYNRYTVGQALLNAVRWGLPATVYTDWGKPEESNYINMLVEQLTGLGIQAENVDRVRATPRHPQAKPIEGWFGRFDRILKNDDVPGYMKRLKDSRENELQQKELQRQIRAGELLPVPDMVEWITGNIDGWNNHNFKNRGVDNGKSPILIYKEEVQQHPVTTLSEDVLDYFFLPIHNVKKIRNCQVAFKPDQKSVRRVYYDRALADYNGYEAKVRFDPYDPSCVWVFVDDKLVCQADEWGMINPKITADVAGRMAEQKRLIRQVTEIYKAYQPPRKGVRRINPHEREAREVKQIRVLKTQLEQEEQIAAAAGGSGPADRFGQLFSIEHSRKVAEIAPARSIMRLTIDDPVEDD